MTTLHQSGAYGHCWSYSWPGAVRRYVILAAIGASCLLGGLGSARADSFLRRQPDPRAATTSEAARRDAIASIPFEHLDRDGRAKVTEVLHDAAAFRRLPTQVIDCDPHLFLLLVRHPDVAVNIWQVLEISNLELRQIDSNRFELKEPTGTRLQAEFLYQNPEIHVVYGEGVYVGPIMGRPVHGRFLLVLRTGYVHETNGRHYVTARLDSFVQMHDRAPELITKLLQPLAGRTADFNFTQIVAFAGSLSRTAEVNHRGVQRLAGQLAGVQPELRVKLAELAADIARNTHGQSASNVTGTSVLTSHESAH